MKAVVQRVKGCELFVDGKLISEIKQGLVIYFGVAVGDTKEKSTFLAKKIAGLRVFEDENKKMNLSVKDISGEILAVSQFTLLADVSHGNRPGFSDAEVPSLAKPMYEFFMDELKKFDIPVKAGIFGADMTIKQINDGPTTIIYEI